MRLAHSFAIAACCVACGAGPSLGPSSPESTGGATVAIGSGVEPVTNYRSTAAALRTLGEDDKKLRGLALEYFATHQMILEGDGALDTVASWVIDHVVSEEGDLRMEAVDFVSHKAGWIGISLSASLATSKGDGWADLLSNTKDSWSAGFSWNRVGIATLRRGTQLFGAIVVGGVRLELEPMPRRYESGSTLAVEGKLGEGLRDAEIVFSRPDGNTTRIPTQKGRKFHGSLVADADGEYRVEVLGTGKEGLKVLANFPVYVGVAPKLEIAVTATTSETADEAAVTLLRLANEERAKHGLPALRSDPKLTLMAHAHSMDMAKNRFFGHRSPQHGDLEQRAQAAGVRPLIYGENVAHAPTSAGVHAALMGSPGHRANILKKEYTHVGVSIVRDPQSGDEISWVATQVFASYPDR
ncbi:MAG: hypothetical protein HRU17_02500 [Polyangiaceae bacterium]|nr:hypothetical protein [Polyangiaceae bacterium]